MRKVDIFKIALTLIAVGLLFWGIRTDQSMFRIAGIACLLIAVALRFLRPRRPLN